LIIKEGSWYGPDMDIVAPIRKGERSEAATEGVPDKMHPTIKAIETDMVNFISYILLYLMVTVDTGVHGLFLFHRSIRCRDPIPTKYLHISKRERVVMHHVVKLHVSKTPHGDYGSIRVGGMQAMRYPEVSSCRYEVWLIANGERNGHGFKGV
jgi:hypothetical protein